MKISEITQAVEGRLKDGGKITSAFMRTLSPKLLQFCQEQVRKKRAKVWSEALCRQLYPDEGYCGMCGGETSYRTMEDRFKPYCSTKCALNDPYVMDTLLSTRGQLRRMELPYLSLSIPEISDRLSKVTAEGKRVTKVLLRQMNAKVLAKCEALEISNPQYGWLAHLYLMINPKSNKCAVCGADTRFTSFKVGFKAHCCTACANADEGKKAKTQRTNLDRYGGSSPIHSVRIQNKMRATTRERYGCDYSAQNYDSVAKRDATMIARYGVKTISQLPEVAKSNARKWKRRAKQAQAARKSTMLARYGKEHNLQVRSLHEKQQVSGFKIKEFTLSGKTFYLRGYEDHAVKYLHEHLGVPVKHILTTAAEGVPSIDYDGHVYHPDIYAKVKGRWVLIEVKSYYTAGLKPRSSLFAVMQTKFKATVAAGYEIKLMVISAKGGITVVHNPHLKTKSQIKALMDN